MQGNSRVSETRFYSSLWLPSVLLGGLLVITLIMEFMLAWQSHDRLQPIHAHISQMVKLQGVNLALQRELVNGLRGNGAYGSEDYQQMVRQLESVLAARALLSQAAPGLIGRAREALLVTPRRPKEALILALSETRKAIDLEARAHQALVDKVKRATALELRIGAIALVLFPTGAALLLYLTRRRIFAPLERLSFLMTLLARPDYRQAPLKSVDPMLRPLTRNYNALVSRLAELEAEHAAREKRLEFQVDVATQALLEQQRSLASTERLAAVGEMTARIAHELRNPLAGVKLACTNLRRDLAQDEPGNGYAERVHSVVAEIDRVIAVLNAMLDQSRHRPEPLSDVDIGQAVADLFVLLRYQIADRIALKHDIPEALVCRLPDVMFRQALLNLLLNAGQAMADRDGGIVVQARVVDASLQLAVCDDGPGFPFDLLEAGIRTFVSHRADGTGLGLSMVQRFARAQGGDVKLANREPSGACVTLELPCGNHYV